MAAPTKQQKINVNENRKKILISFGDLSESQQPSLNAAHEKYIQS